MEISRESAVTAELLRFAQETAARRQTASYPLLTGRALEAELERRAGEGGLLRLAGEGGETRGALSFFALPEEAYAQTTGVFVREGDSAAARALLGRCAELCRGCELLAGLAGENGTASAALADLGFEVCERSSHLEFSGRAPGGGGAARLGRAGLEEYLRFHRAQFPDIWWNAERLAADFDAWRIYALGSPVHSGLFLRACGGRAEIFGLAARDVPAARELLSGALAELSGEPVTYMAPPGSAGEAAALSLGFDALGEYVCWRYENA